MLSKPYTPRVASLLAAIFIAPSAEIAVAQEAPLIEIAPRAETTLQPLNPLRGDLSPKAGVLWGDIRQDVPTGTLIEFVDGFSSPPHIHNITYRGVVISGFVHNDDPDAEKLWLGPGSFWTQPAGETHITAAQPGAPATAFLEILEGPYLVQPAAEAFDNGERPISIEARNVVWLSAADTSWLHDQEEPSATQLAFLWGEPSTRNGTFLRLGPGESGALEGGDAWLRAVVIAGEARHRSSENGEAARLETGSYFGSRGGATHQVECADAPCLFYISTEGAYRFTLN